MDWRAPVPRAGKGVYAIALAEALDECPLSAAALEELLDVRRELTLDGERPEANELRERLTAFWLRV